MRKTSLQSINISYKSTFFLGQPKQQQKDAQYLFYKFARNSRDQIPQARIALSNVPQLALVVKTKGKLWRCFGKQNQKQSCQMFYTSKIPNFFGFTREKRINHDIFAIKIRMDNVDRVYIGQVVNKK